MAAVIQNPFLYGDDIHYLYDVLCIVSFTRLLYMAQYW